MKQHFGTLLLIAVLGTTLHAQAGQRVSPPSPPKPPVLPERIRELHLHELNDLQVKLDHDLQLKLDMERFNDLKLQYDPELLRLQTEELSRRAEELAQQAVRQAHVADAWRQEVRWSDGFPQFHLFDASQQTVACSNLPGPRFPHDAADSLYSQARTLVNAGDYRAAIIRLTELQQRHASSRCIPPGMYYHAFALYRIGGDSDLREALTILDSHRTKFPGYTMAGEVTALATRVRGRLAERGDANAQALLRSAGAEGGARCDTEDQAVRSEALSALMRIDPDAAMPKLRAILEQQDACLQLRRGALQILGRRRDDQPITALITTARSDSSSSLRSTAVSYVAQYETDAAAQALEAIARNDQSDQVRRSAARGLVGHPSPRARTAARALLEDNALSDNIRTDMLSRYTSERATADDAVWLKTLLPRVSSSRVKQAIVSAVGRIGRTEDHPWLMELSTNDQEPAQIRAEAFRHVARTMTVPQLSQAYDNAGSTATREQILRALDSRPESAASDKLLEVVRRGTDPRVRAVAIQLLMAKKDPRLTAALLELIDR